MVGPLLVLLTLAALSHLSSEYHGVSRTKGRKTSINSYNYPGRGIRIPQIPPLETDGGNLSINIGHSWTPERTLRWPQPGNSPGVRGRWHRTAVRRLSLVERWRRSVVALTRLADQNLSLAKNHLGMQDHALALQHATSSLENISRVLIHCLGGKPEIGGGQEEALRILCTKLQGEGKVELEEAIESLVIANQELKTARTYLKSNRKQQAVQSNIHKTIESVSKTVAMFRQIVVKHFTSELRSLNFSCPRCQSLYIRPVWDGHKTGVDRECGLCNHRWFGKLDGPRLHHIM